METYFTIRDFMIANELNLFQCDTKVYINTPNINLQCMINNVKHKIRFCEQIQNLESIKKSIDSFVKPIKSIEPKLGAKLLADMP